MFLFQKNILNINISFLDNQNGELYDLRTVKKFVKEITHFPKEIFARKLAWKFPPLALGKFHKWLLSKLERFDCEAPKTPANYVFDAYSQSLYLSRSIFDLVNLIRTLLIMEKNQSITTKPAVAPAEFNNPAVMASFLAELADIRTQIARTRQQQDPNQVQTQITRQEAEIRVLREQLLRYEAKIAELTESSNHYSAKDNDLSSFFRESLKKIKLKTMRRKTSLSLDRSRHLAEYRPYDNEKSETLPLPTRRHDTSFNGKDTLDVAENTYSNTNLTTTSSTHSSNPGTSTPAKPKRSKVRFPGSPSPDHNEIVIKVGEQVSAITQKSDSPDEVLLSRGTRERSYSSDDDYVQMHSILSRDSTLERSRDSKAHVTKADQLEDVCYRSVAPTEGTVIRRVSADHRSSVDSKSSVDSLKMKHKHKIMISSDPHDSSSDYIQMNGSPANDDGNESDGDYVKFDQISRKSSSGSYQDQHGIVNTSDEFSQFDQSYGDGKSSIMSNTLPSSISPNAMAANQQPCKRDHVNSCSTIKFGVALLEERQINAVSSCSKLRRFNLN